MNSEAILVADPTDPTDDMGPRHRLGLLTLFVGVFCVLSLAGVALTAWRAGFPKAGWMLAIVATAVALWVGWHLRGIFRRHPDLPVSHSFLSRGLGFDIHSTCHDVAATFFFDPDVQAPDARIRLLCFLENYASRRRVARLRIGPHPSLGLLTAQVVGLHLAAGQATVYALPLRLSPEMPSGEHDLPVTLKMECPAGAGLRLPGSRHHHDLWTVHFAVPISVDDAARPDATVSPEENACYLSLASVSQRTPDPAILERLLRDGPMTA